MIIRIETINYEIELKILIISFNCCIFSE